MKIESVHVENYKSFRDTGPIKLGPRVTVIVGKNNSGKTALLEAIAGEFGNQSHRSPQTMPTRHSHPTPESKVTFELVLREGDCDRILDFARRDRFEIHLHRATGAETSLRSYCKACDAGNFRIRASRTGGGDIRSYAPAYTTNRNCFRPNEALLDRWRLSPATDELASTSTVAPDWTTGTVQQTA